MRIRQVKPDFWADELLAAQPDTVRLFYIGTWQLADDAGYIEWSVGEIGLRLYGYRPRGLRERWVIERSGALVSIGRLVMFECAHAYLPKLTEHQKFGGRPVFTVRDAHARDCAPLRANAPHGRVGNGTVGKGIQKVASDDHRIQLVDGKYRAS